MDNNYNTHLTLDIIRYKSVPLRRHPSCTWLLDQKKNWLRTRPALLAVAVAGAGPFDQAERATVELVGTCGTAWSLDVGIHGWIRNDPDLSPVVEKLGMYRMKKMCPPFPEAIFAMIGMSFHESVHFR